MTNQLHTINHSASLREADLLFYKYHIRHLPVVDEGKLIGMLSLTDLQRVSFVSYFSEEERNISAAIYDMLTINQIMVRNVKTVAPDDKISDAAKVLVKEGFHALPVVEGEQLIGIVTSTDLIKLLIED